MVVLDPAIEPYTKVLPEVTDFSRPFLEALKAHEFKVQKCSTCGEYGWVPYPACRTCFSDTLEWTTVSGKATLYSYTVIHRAAAGFADDAPYVVAMGELVEKPRSCLVFAELVGSDPETLHIGQPLEIAFLDIPSEDLTVYRWVAETSEPVT